MFADCYFDDLTTVYSSSSVGTSTPDMATSLSGTLPPYSAPPTPLCPTPRRSVTFLLDDRAREKSECNHPFWRTPSPSRHYTKLECTRILRRLSDPEEYLSAENEGPRTRMRKMKSAYYRLCDIVRHPLDRYHDRKRRTGLAGYTYIFPRPPLVLHTRRHTTGPLARC